MVGRCALDPGEGGLSVQSLLAGLELLRNRAGARRKGPCGAATRTRTLRRAEGFLGEFPAPFHSPTLRPGPCRPIPLSYMRHTVAISRAFDLGGFGSGCRL